MSYVVLYVCDFQKTTMAAMDLVSELESVSSLKEQQRMTLKASLDGNNVLTLLPTGFGESSIYQMAPLVTWFVDLTGGSQSAIDRDRQVQSPVKYFF